MKDKVLVENTWFLLVLISSTKSRRGWKYFCVCIEKRCISCENILYFVIPETLLVSTLLVSTSDTWGTCLTSFGKLIGIQQPGKHPQVSGSGSCPGAFLLVVEHPLLLPDRTALLQPDPKPLHGCRGRLATASATSPRGQPWKKSKGKLERTLFSRLSSPRVSK